MNVQAAEADNRRELTIRQRAPIEFGVFSGSAGGGILRIDARSGARTASGVSLLGGNYGQAEFEITGQPAEEVMVYLPGEIRLESQSGGHALALTELAASPSEILTLDSQGKARLFIGGALKVPPRTGPGQYNGIFSLDARYVR